MRVGRTAELRRHQRVEYSKPFHGVTVGKEFDGMIEDISAGGAALAVDIVGTHFNNNDFVELHIQSMDRKVNSQIVRKYEGGVAVQFKIDAEEQKRIQQALDEFASQGGLENI